HRPERGRRSREQPRGPSFVRALPSRRRPWVLEYGEEPSRERSGNRAELGERISVASHFGGGQKPSLLREEGSALRVILRGDLREVRRDRRVVSLVADPLVDSLLDGEPVPHPARQLTMHAIGGGRARPSDVPPLGMMFGSKETRGTDATLTFATVPRLITP